MSYGSKSRLIKLKERLYAGYTISASDIEEIKDIAGELEKEDKKDIENFVLTAINSYVSRQKINDKLNTINKSKIAKLLGCSLATVYRKVKEDSFTNEELEIIEELIDE